MRPHLTLILASLLVTSGMDRTFAQSGPRVRLEAPLPLVEVPPTPIVQLGEPVAPGAQPASSAPIIRAQDSSPDPDPVYRLPGKSDARSEPKFGFDEPVPQGIYRATKSQERAPDDILDRRATLDTPSGAKQVSGVTPVALTPAQEEERYNSGFVETRVRDNEWLERQATKNTKKSKSLLIDEDDELLKPTKSTSKPSWWSKFGKSVSLDWEEAPEPGGGEGGGFMMCDTDFAKGWISPVSNPFLAEDPRTLTELRPVFVYQVLPEGNPFYNGGNLEAFTLQGRIAFTERLSLVIHKLGGMWIQPGQGSIFGDQGGFTEIWLGPKYTFVRGTESKTVMAGGLQFQIPIGADQIYQDTGDFSMVPYLAVGQKFGTTGIGTWNVQNTLGYSFAINGERSSFIYNSLHLDLDVGDKDKFFPLMELNWYHYTTNGTARPYFNFEGTDLANIGAPMNGTSYLSIAAGGRYKFSERFQIGAAAEFPLTTPKNMDFRLTLDMILRF